MGKSKYNYWQFIFLTLFIITILLMFLINQNSLYKVDFNNSYSHESDYNNLESFSDQYKFIQKEIDYIPNQVLSMKTRGEINETQMDLILSERSQAIEYFESYEQGKDKDDFQRALFHIQQAYSSMETLPTINCANNVEVFSQKYTPWLFYYLSYSDKEKISKIISTRDRLLSFLQSNSLYSEEFDVVLRDTVESLNIRDSMELYKLKCDSFENYIQKDYQRQRNWLVFKFMALIIAIVAGIFLNSWYTKWANRNRDEKTKFSTKLNNLFNPKEIKPKTIETIIKMNTIIAVFGTLAVWLISSNEILLKVFGYLAFADVLTILLSIVFGIYSLNNDSERAKRGCYSLFVWGILGFIGVIIFFFVIIALTGFGSIVKQSFQTFLNNQTVS